MAEIDPQILARRQTNKHWTTNHRQAERCAAKWEAELQEGRYKRPLMTTWEEFRERYEQEHLSGLADGTFEKVQSVFNLVERILAPVRLRDITASRIPFFQTKLRKTRSEDTLCEKWAGAPFR